MALRAVAEFVGAGKESELPTAQVVVEEVQRFVGGDAGEPEGELGEFDGQRIDVHAVDAGFHDAPAPVGCLGVVLRMPGGTGILPALTISSRDAAARPVATICSVIAAWSGCSRICSASHSVARTRKWPLPMAGSTRLSRRTARAKELSRRFSSDLACERRLHIRSGFDFVEQRLKRFADEVADNPVGRVEDAVAVVLAVLVRSSRRPSVFVFQVRHRAGPRRCRQAGELRASRSQWPRR